MQVKDAIRTAKEYVADIFSDEGVFNVGLEEVEFRSPVWEVTVGFSRKWDRAPRSPFANVLEQQSEPRALIRTYKIVEVDDETGRVLGVRNRAGLQ